MHHHDRQITYFLQYAIVGALGTIVEWAGFWLFNDHFHIQYLIATTLAFIIATFANWGFGRLILFKTSKYDSLGKELLSIYMASTVGLVLNLIIMFLLVHLLTLDEMLAKIIASGMVFFYNFLIRKLVIYKN